MYTESDAKNLWCPLVLHEGKSGGSFNRGRSPGNPINRARTEIEDSHLCNCIGRRCAIWRWAPQRPSVTLACPNPQSMIEPPRPPDMPPGWFFIPYMPYIGILAHWIEPEPCTTQQGYCGWVPPGL